MSYELSYEWLKKLVVGSKVFVDGRESFLTKVSKITATKIEVESFSATFRTDDGRQKGSGDVWNRRFLSEATPERLDEWKKTRRRHRIAATNWSEVSDDQLAAIDKILNPAKS